MRKNMHVVSLFTLLTAGMMLIPAHSHAQEKKEAKPADKKVEAAGDANKADNANRALPFRGKVDAVDKDAKTVKVGERVFQVSTQTKIEKDGKSATLADAVVGEPVRGSARKGDDGKLTLVSVSFGAKETEK